MNRLATLGFGLALCGVFSACGSDGGTSSSEDNNPEFESSSSAGENLSSSQNLITSSATETLSSAEVVNLSSSAVDGSGSSVESVGSSSSVFNKSSSSVSSGSNPAGGLNPDGTFTDSRDGKTYKTVKVGNQVWMAENLQYEIADGSACYNDDSGYCEVFGRLYSWDAAMDACPEGWTLPSELDWYALVDEVGDADLRFSQGWAGGMPPKNDYDFAVLAAGYGSYGFFSSNGSSAIFWTATENCTVGGASCEESIGFVFGYESPKPSRSSLEKEIVVSVRCIMESSGTQDNSSSSASLVDPSTVVKGSMTDARDGKTYKTVTIGTQTWMAENLNYAYNLPTATLDSSSICFENNPESCAQFGRLYLWSAAMDSAAVFGTAGKHCGYAEGNWDHVCERPNLKTRGVCPEGWHIPSKDEWNTLFSAVGGRFTAAPKLKATDGWAENGNGTDDYGFSAVPTGFWEDPDRFGGAGERTEFWASTEDNGYNAWEARFGYYSGEVDFWPGSKKYGASVRCIKD